MNKSIKQSIWARIALFSVLGLASFSASAIENCTLNGKPVNTANGNETRGQSGRVVCKDSDSGNLLREFELKDGKQAGQFRFYQMGKLVRQYTADERNRINGLSQEWNVEGQLLVEANYKDGELNGLQKLWSSEGKPTSATYYEKGQPKASVSWGHSGKLDELNCYSKPVLKPAFDDAKACGHHGSDSPVDIHDRSGDIRERLTYRKGTLYKREELWPNGTPSTVEINGEGTRTVTNFTESGSKRYVLETAWVNNSWQKTLEQTFTDEDKVKEESKWAVKGDRVVPVYEKVYTFIGKPKRFTEYSEQGGKTFITETEFHGNGKPSFKGQQKVVDAYSRVFVGKHEHYFESGQLYQLLEYDNNGNLLREQQFDEVGNVTKDVKS